MSTRKTPTDTARLDALVAETHRSRDQRELGYREQALKMYPWICGRCSREFRRENLHELTVHHRDHNHDNNPPDGSNWELLCLYCHDNEHSRLLDGEYTQTSVDAKEQGKHATHKPFGALEALLKNGK